MNFYVIFFIIKQDMNAKLLRKFIHNFLRTPTLYEGKAAAVKLLSQFDDELTYAPFTQEIIDKFLPATYGEFPTTDDGTIIGDVLSKLGKEELLNIDRSPKFRFGSSRLAAYKKYGDEQLLSKGETPELAKKAGEQKETYGDLDVDVQFAENVAPKEIASYIESNFPFIKTLVTAEIHLAIKYQNNVYQVDLVNVKSQHEKTEEIFQFSSFNDLVNNVKGVFRMEMLKAVAASKPVEIDLNAIKDYVTENPDNDFSNQYLKFINCGYEPINLRYQISKSGVRLILDFTKQNVKTEKRLACPLGNTLNYDDLDIVAKFLLNDENTDEATIMSAMNLANYVGGNFSATQKQKIINSLIDNKSINRIDIEDQKKGLDAIIGQINNAGQQITEQHWMHNLSPRRVTAFFVKQKQLKKNDYFEEIKYLKQLKQKISNKQLKNTITIEDLEILKEILKEIQSDDVIFALNEKMRRLENEARALTDSDFDFTNNRSSTYLD